MVLKRKKQKSNSLEEQRSEGCYQGKEETIPDEEDYIKYRQARRHSTKVVRTAKENSWRQYGKKKLSEKCKTSPKEFSKSVKAMMVRDELYDPLPSSRIKMQKLYTRKEK